VRSVRARVTLVATVIVLLVLSATGVALVAAQSAVLTDNVDEVLARSARSIQDQLEEVTTTGSIPGMGDDDAFGHVIDGTGQVLASTPGPAADFPLEDMGLVGPEGDQARYQTVHIPDAADYRVMILPVVDGIDIIVGTPLDDVQDSVTALIRALLVAVPAASLVLALLVWLLVGRVLRPVERIRQQVAAIGGESLDRRVPVPASGDEIARLAQTMNGMLERLEGSSERQRRFVADASHELRGPLTRIRTELEVDLAHPETADLAATHRSILDDTEGLENLVDDLLTLARSDDGRVVGRRDPVDLDDVVLSEVGRLAADIRAGVDVSEVSGAQVLGDRGQLARVVRNLLDNALRHGRPPVRIALREEDGAAVLRVSDEGDGVPAGAEERIFERFARVDDARSGARSTGLGLAIARELVEAHGGTIAIDRSQVTGVCFEVRLPL
jgi:signal transduction histidine kinase